MSGAVGVVVIGRNEGQRLRRCLESLGEWRARAVYVDSGSSDGSIDLATSHGVEIVELDCQTPFTAARARNQGFERLHSAWPDCEFVQFIDGDCELQPGWVEAASKYLHSETGVAVACGRRRERFPQASVYNRLCDLEWETPIGDADSCGGDTLVRVEAFRAVGGFREDLIAGEEPELCARLRGGGWRIHRLDAEMSLHDASMTRFGQWWRRAVRAGHACAQVSRLCASDPTRLWRREVRSAWLWAVGLPAGTLLAVGCFGVLGLWLLLLYPIQIARVAARCRLSWGWRTATIYSFYCLLAKWAYVQGTLVYWRNRWRGTPPRLIEYKPPTVAGASS